MFFFRRRKKQPPGRSPEEIRSAIVKQLQDGPALTSLQRALLKTIATSCAPRIAPSPISEWRVVLTRASRVTAVARARAKQYQSRP